MHEASTRSPSRNSLPTVAKLDDSSSPLGDFEHALDEPRLTWAVDTGSEVRALSTFDLWYALNTGALAGNVRVWRLGREAWTSALDVPELACALRVSSASLPGIAEPRATLDYTVIPPAFAEVPGGSVPEIPSALLLSPEELEAKLEVASEPQASPVGEPATDEAAAEPACEPEPSCEDADWLLESEKPAACDAKPLDRTPHDADAEAPTMMPPLVLSSLNPTSAETAAAQEEVRSVTPLPAFTPSDVPTAFELSTSVTAPPPASLTPTWRVRAKERRPPSRSTIALAFAAAVSLGAAITLAGVSGKRPEASPAALAAGDDTVEAVETQPAPSPVPEPSLATPAPEAPSAAPAEPVTPSASVAAAPKPRAVARPGNKPAKAATGATKRSKSFTPSKKGQQRARQGTR